MTLNLNTTKTVSLPTRALNGVNEIGSQAINFAKKSCDKFTKTKTVQNISQKTGIKKETFVGAGIILFAIGSAIKLFSGIKNKIKESKIK